MKRMTGWRWAAGVLMLCAGGCVRNHAVSSAEPHRYKVDPATSQQDCGPEGCPIPGPDGKITKYPSTRPANSSAFSPGGWQTPGSPGK